MPWLSGHGYGYCAGQRDRRGPDMLRRELFFVCDGTDDTAEWSIGCMAHHCDLTLAIIPALPPQMI
ncbi:MAG: hypothetical protein GY938_22665, partial [Ketobacter sp.]|nr:hypothetical protein [Ketobacter sp.]